jgi:hypothetical protein
MTARRLLSTELWSKLAWPQLINPPPLRSNYRRLQSTLSADSSRLLTSFHSNSNTEAATQEQLDQLENNVFERYTPEYEEVGLSTLDHPSTPRSPTDSLLHLLRLKLHHDADTLLKEILATGQPIDHNVAFAQHAELLMSTDRKSTWLDWWALAPSISSVQAESARGMSQNIALRANERARRMMTMAMEDSSDLEAMSRFGEITAGKGLARLVGESLLSYMAAFAPREESEKVWKACLATAQEPVVVKAASKMFIPLREAAEWSVPRLHHAQDRMVRTVTRDRQGIKVESLDFLRAKRGQMLRIHAAFGRLDYAIHLIESADNSTADDERRSIPILAYLFLLDVAAKSDQFDLFQRLYSSMRKSSSRITIIASPTRTTQLPVFARSVTAPQINGQEILEHDAFIAFRYSGSNSSPEEGGGYQVAHASDSLIRDALVRNDLRSVFAELRSCIESGTTPSLKATTDAILLARSEGYDSFIDALLMEMKGGGIGTRAWTRGYWTTAAMLAHIRKEDYLLAVLDFKRSFEIQGLPRVVREVLDHYQTPLALREEANLAKQRKKMIPKAHSFSILMQALVPLVDSRIDGRMVITQLYDSITQEEIFIQRRRTSTIDKSSSPLDPYTFMPFLRAFGSTSALSASQIPESSASDSASSESRRVDPLQLLHVLLTMHHLGLPPSLPHWSLILGTFASSTTTPPSDLIFILDLLESQPPSTAPSSDELARMMLELIKHRKGGKIGGGRGIGLIAYTSMMVGLSKRGEYLAARAIQARMTHSVLGGNANGKGGDKRLIEVAKRLDKQFGQDRI